MFANEVDRVVVFDEHVVEVFALFFFAFGCVAVSFNAILQCADAAHFVLRRVVAVVV